MIRLKDIIASGRFQSGYLDGHNLRAVETLPWNGAPDDRRGFIRRANLNCEDDMVRDVIQMHPKWGNNSTIKAWLPFRRLPSKAVFKAKIGFLKGAVGTDGVTFQVWEHHDHRGRRIWNRITNQYKAYSGALVEVIADLSHLSGKDVGIELRVDSGAGSGQDWAIWIDPVIEARSIAATAKEWSINPTRVRIVTRNETRLVEGFGDEPYLGGIYFSSVFGKRGTTKVHKLDKLQTLGENVRTAVAIPQSAELAVTDTAITWDNPSDGFVNGIPIMGYILVAMEEDKRGKSQVKAKIDELAGKLYDSLKRNVEDNAAGLLNADRTIERIERDVYGSDGSFSGRNSIADAFANAIKWLFRVDDLIGQNQVILVGVSERELTRVLGSDYQPDADTNVIAALNARNFNLKFQSDQGHYIVSITVSNTNNGLLVRGI